MPKNLLLLLQFSCFPLAKKQKTNSSSSSPPKAFKCQSIHRSAAALQLGPRIAIPSGTSSLSGFSFGFNKICQIMGQSRFEMRGGRSLLIAPDKCQACNYREKTAGRDSGTSKANKTNERNTQQSDAHFVCSSQHARRSLRLSIPAANLN